MRVGRVYFSLPLVGDARTGWHCVSVSRTCVVLGSVVNGAFHSYRVEFDASSASADVARGATTNEAIAACASLRSVVARCVMSERLSRTHQMLMRALQWFGGSIARTLGTISGAVGVAAAADATSAAAAAVAIATRVAHHCAAVHTAAAAASLVATHSVPDVVYAAATSAAAADAAGSVARAVDGRARSAAIAAECERAHEHCSIAVDCRADTVAAAVDVAGGISAARISTLARGRAAGRRRAVVAVVDAAAGVRGGGVCEMGGHWRRRDTV
jgi:hypothetical protein